MNSAIQRVVTSGTFSLDGGTWDVLVRDTGTLALVCH